MVRRDAAATPSPSPPPSSSSSLPPPRRDATRCDATRRLEDARRCAPALAGKLLGHGAERYSSPRDVRSVISSAREATHRYACTRTRGTFRRSGTLRSFFTVADARARARDTENVDVNDDSSDLPRASRFTPGCKAVAKRAEVTRAN